MVREVKKARATAMAFIMLRVSVELGRGTARVHQARYHDALADEDRVRTGDASNLGSLKRATRPDTLENAGGMFAFLVVYVAVQ